MEELLARLLQDNGYRLLVSAKQDPDALVQGKNGLLVRGRGGNHQADVLGEFDLPVPFSLPLRIFVEAKCNRTSVRLPVVRNAYGTVHDVNEQYSPFSSDPNPVSVRRYHYRYTLFSTSGFSTDAQRYALAHQISLVDLSNPGFAQFRALVEQVADAMYDLATRNQISTFPLGQMRIALRHTLETWTGDDLVTVEEFEFSETIDDLAESQDEPEVMTSSRTTSKRPARKWLPEHELAQIMAGLRAEPLGELLIGFPAAPFILVFKCENPAAFAAYLHVHPSSEIRVHIEFAERGHHDGDWVIVPAHGPQEFRLLFALPDLLADWLLNSEGPAAPRVRDIKRGMLSSLVVFQGNRLIRLLYEPHPDRQRHR
ncbi:restriction endonuclease [Nocardia aurantiaca]|uniref:restriction endonuclease n=1 Tax=Nocardia aurantiaca TaxID=2675850 RepID=UPI001E4BD266